MQDVTPWPANFDVSEPVARVLVDGIAVEVESVEVTAELDSAMPDRVAAGGGGVVAATGTASILRTDDVAEAGFNPWGDAEQLVNASEVVVEAGYRDPATGGVGCARQIIGQVESLDGGATSNSVGLEFVDYTPLLDRNITVEPLMEWYPSLEDGGPVRAPGLSTMYVTDRVLRHCGFYATPPVVSGAVVSAPMMGSAIPERGTLFAAQRVTGSGAVELSHTNTPWGVVLSHGVARYLPEFGSRGHGRLSSTLHVSFHRVPSPSGSPTTSRIDVLWGAGTDGVHVHCDAHGTVAVRYRTAGVVTTVCTLSSVHVAESAAFTVLVTPSGQATIYASNGASATGTQALPSRATVENMREVVVQVPNTGHRLGGVQVAFSAARNELFQRTTHFGDWTAYEAIRAFPAQLEVNCLALLKEQAAAEVSAMWVDEYGHFRWQDRHQLSGSTPVGTLTSMDDLLDLSWELPVRSVFSKVEVSHKSPTITRRTEASITVADGRGGTLVNNESEARFFEPPADEDWVQVQNPSWLGGTIDYYQLKRGRGSYRGGIVADDDDNERLAYSSRLSSVWSQINPQRWVLESSAQGLSGDEYIEQRLRDRPDLYGRFADEPLPIIRARGLVQWEKDTLTGTQRGPLLAPVFTHDVGPWVQNQNSLRDLSNWLAENLTQPGVVLRRVPITPDPRIQLGDVFWLEDQTAYRVRLRVVIMGKTLTYQATGSGHEMSQEITCRVIAIQKPAATYTDLQSAWAGRDYDDFENIWAGRDYDDLENNPLERI